MPYFTLRPASGETLLSTKAPLLRLSAPAWIAVTVGRISRLRLVDSEVMPSSVPICVRKPEMPRETGDQTARSSLLSMLRTI